MSGFSFPTIELPEMIAVVRGWGIREVQPADISGCDAHTLQTIYTSALQRVTGITVDALEQVTDKLVKDLDATPVRSLCSRPANSTLTSSRRFATTVSHWIFCFLICKSQAPYADIRDI